MRENATEIEGSRQNDMYHFVLESDQANLLSGSNIPQKELKLIAEDKAYADIVVNKDGQVQEINIYNKSNKELLFMQKTEDIPDNIYKVSDKKINLKLEELPGVFSLEKSKKGSQIH